MGNINRTDCATVFCTIITVHSSYSRLDRVLILLGLTLYVLSASVCAVFMVLYVHYFFFVYMHLLVS